jgi:hypothetical protein
MIDFGVVNGSFYTRQALPLAVVATGQDTPTLMKTLVTCANGVDMASYPGAVIAMRYLPVDQNRAFHEAKVLRLPARKIGHWMSAWKETASVKDFHSTSIRAGVSATLRTRMRASSPWTLAMLWAISSAME